MSGLDKEIETRLAEAEPEVEVLLLNRLGEPGLGVGECAAGPTAAALANALFNAIGVRARQLPLTPDRIARALLPTSQRLPR